MVAGSPRSTRSAPRFAPPRALRQSAALYAPSACWGWSRSLTWSTRGARQRFGGWHAGTCSTLLAWIPGSRRAGLARCVAGRRSRRGSCRPGTCSSSSWTSSFTGRSSRQQPLPARRPRTQRAAAARGRWTRRAAAARRPWTRRAAAAIRLRPWRRHLPARPPLPPFEATCTAGTTQTRADAGHRSSGGHQPWLSAV